MEPGEPASEVTVGPQPQTVSAISGPADHSPSQNLASLRNPLPCVSMYSCTSTWRPYFRRFLFRNSTVRQGLRSFPNRVFAVISARCYEPGRHERPVGEDVHTSSSFTQQFPINKARPLTYLVHSLLPPFLITVLLIVRLSALRNPHRPNYLVSAPFRLGPCSSLFLKVAFCFFF